MVAWRNAFPGTPSTIRARSMFVDQGVPGSLGYGRGPAGDGHDSVGSWVGRWLASMPARWEPRLDIFHQIPLRLSPPVGHRRTGIFAFDTPIMVVHGRGHSAIPSSPGAPVGVFSVRESHWKPSQALHSMGWTESPLGRAAIVRAKGVWRCVVSSSGFR